ncbi:hypothetical protein [Sinomonas sp. ASV322]|uniref:hypothetical protein n=1 Tax=Sinomonas sp. ASV322 TaxID=3041920 RepID=UPI0027DEA532|nr:hypothetical protein [Sinomonas sp. ASV322]MDQ4502515.1 hypothetical protein [Sinomonas sp. ASV322]
MATSHPTGGHVKRFELRLESHLPAAQAWARILNLRAHDRLIPFTHIVEGIASADELRPGHRFVACTMIDGVRFRGRRLGFFDVMTIEEISPPSADAPGHARIVKSGKLIRGSVEVTVSPSRAGASTAAGASTILWAQEFGLARFPRVIGAIAQQVAPVAYRSMLKRLLRG